MRNVIANAGDRRFESGLRMKRARKEPLLRNWRVSLIRKRGAYLGDVTAPDRDAAEAAAVEEFKLTAEQRKRLVIQERA